MGILRLAVVSLAAWTAAAQTQPPAWGYLPPDAKALVGFHLKGFEQAIGTLAKSMGATKKTVTSSPGAEQWASMVNELVMVGPEEYGIAIGKFDLLTLRAASAKSGATEERYRNAVLLLDKSKPSNSVAWISDEILLLGTRERLKQLIDRGPSQQPNPLWQRSRPLASKYEIWVIASDLRAAAGVLPGGSPFDLKTLANGVREMEAGLSFAAGFGIHAVLIAESEAAAEKLEGQLRAELMKQSGKTPPPPEFADAMKLSRAGDRLTVDFHFDLAALFTQMGAALAEGLKQGFEQAGRELEPPREVRPSKPGVIRIHGLDDGVKEIKVEPKKP
ncbi:MAG: hypothetical protein K2X35_20825 [Bryobacteraceae bacterium]|nr:hypothetical protein [Bryobacteraceae bacterium]